MVLGNATAQERVGRELGGRTRVAVGWTEAFRLVGGCFGLHDRVVASTWCSGGQQRTRKVWDASDGHAGAWKGDMWPWRADVVDGRVSGGGGG